jgi:hypothetical protein
VFRTEFTSWPNPRLLLLSSIWASPPVHSMWPWTLKLDEESNHLLVWLSGKWFFPCIFA